MRTTLLVGFLALVLNCHAASLLYIETEVLPGLWEYEFIALNSLDPQSQSGFDLYGISFEFPIAPTVLLLPPGWDYFEAGNTIESFSTIPGPIPGGSDLPPGQSLSGFVFLLNQQIDGIPFTYTITNPGDPGQPILLTGVATAVPEPGSMTALCLGLVFTCALKFSRRPRRYGTLMSAASKHNQ